MGVPPLWPSVGVEGAWHEEESASSQEEEGGPGGAVVEGVATGAKLLLRLGSCSMFSTDSGLCRSL